MSKPIKPYTLKMFSSLYISYISINLIIKKSILKEIKTKTRSFTLEGEGGVNGCLWLLMLLLFKIFIQD